jgi:hypothetical protein
LRIQTAAIKRHFTDSGKKVLGIKTACGAIKRYFEDSGVKKAF